MVATLLKSFLRTQTDSDLVKQELLAAVDEYAAKKVVLDLHLVQDIRTVVITGLALFHRKFTKEMGGQVAVCGLTPHLSDVFRVIRWIDTAGETGPIIAEQPPGTPGPAKAPPLIKVVTPDAATAVALLTKDGK